MGQKLADKCQLATDSEINPLSNHRETKRETRRGSVLRKLALYFEMQTEREKIVLFISQ